MIYLPGHKGLTLERGEGAEARDEAEPADLHQGDAVEQDAVGQDEGDVGPAHTGPHSQQPVHEVHQRPVLWDRNPVSRLSTTMAEYTLAQFDITP